MGAISTRKKGKCCRKKKINDKLGNKISVSESGEQEN